MPMRTNRCFAPILSDPEVRALFDTDATLVNMLAFERALTEALGAVGAADAVAVSRALSAMDGFQPDLDAVEAGAARDGLPVPEWVRQLKTAAGPAAASALHVGATSQDVLDTALALSLRAANERISERLAAVAASLDALATEAGERTLMGRTRMQAALPVRAADRVALWRRPLKDHATELTRLRPLVERVQYAGPVGLRDVPAGQGDAVADGIAERLGLARSDCSWHANREHLVAYGQFLARLTGSLGKLGQDVALMAQQGIDEIRVAGGGISSAMPHKQNPVLAETLVALARFNAVQSGGLAQCLIHEQERSGVAWTLEWLLLPPMVETAALSLKLAVDLVGRIEFVS